MNKYLIWFTLCILSACGNNKSRLEIISKADTLDALTKRNFEFHFKILDSLTNLSYNDSMVVGGMPSIEFMEEKTNIEAHSDGTSFGKLEFSKNDLHRWHEWYDKKNK